MHDFARLLDRLFFTYANRDKAALIQDYLARTPDPDRGWAVAAIAGELRFDFFKSALVRDLIKARTDPVLFDMSYDYVGELSETVAHLWPHGDSPRLNALPPLHEVVERFASLPKAEVASYLSLLLDNATPSERWALLKLGTRGLRIGVSARFLKQILAAYGQIEVGEIEEVWHGLEPPYRPLFAWLEGRAPKPDIGDAVIFHPVMLAHPLDERDLDQISPQTHQAEWKYDGVRVQLVSAAAGRALFSRTGDDISAAFPDVIAQADFRGVLDGELLVWRDGRLGSFNDLQKRLNRKRPGKALISEMPGHLIVYDVLKLGDEDLRALPLDERRSRLAAWFAATRPDGMSLSQTLAFATGSELGALRAATGDEMTAGLPSHLIEGLMIKRRDSSYVAGRPKGLWYKWKRDPRLVDAVLMYAQRGHGKRSSFYSDYTFGLWRGAELLPVGKAYFGFTDEELREIDKWVRNNTVGRFGPVREVSKALVFEVAFDAVHRSGRHKSGLAMRFPRINRIRWDKPAAEADNLAALEAHVR
jgi:DNA ligase-1